MPVLSGSEPMSTGQPDNVVRSSPTTPSGGGQGSKVGTPQQQQVPALTPSVYDMGGDFYYHPSQGVGTMTGVWGDKRAGGARRHEGQDIRMPMNTPLVAVTSGVIQHYRNSSAGTVVYLKGDDGNKYSYFHLNSRVAKHGQRVQGGQLIAYSGNTGNSSGPHLHFETWIGGKKVDPRIFLSHTRLPGEGAPTVDPRIAKEEKYFPETNEPMGLDLWGQRRFQDDLANIYNSIDWTIPEDTTYGAWYDQLLEFQRDATDQGLIQNPRRLKAHNLLRNTIAGMAAMVKKSGYESAYPSPNELSPEGENVVVSSREEE